MHIDFINRFQTLQNIPTTAPKEAKQKRGLDFEALINEIALAEKIQLSKSYYADADSSEQIDGAIEVYGRIFLLEVKWVASDLAASELYSFIGKIENKFHGTLGVFISRKALSENFISALNRGRRQSVIVVHGEDIDELFKPDGPQLKDYLKHCFKLLSYRNLTHFSVADYVKIIADAEKQQSGPATETNKEAKAFIVDNFIDKRTPNDKMFALYSMVAAENRQEIFNYAIANFHGSYQQWHTNFSGAIYPNISDFLRLFNDQSLEVKNSIELFYQSLLANGFKVYGQLYIMQLYVDHFKDTKPATRNAINKLLISEFSKAEQWEEENQLTYFIDHNWAILAEETRAALKNIYLDIFISRSREDRFAQKQFSIKLLEEGMTSALEIKQWLDDKLALLKSSETDGQVIDLAWWAADIYSPVMPYLQIPDWRQYIQSQLV